MNITQTQTANTSLAIHKKKKNLTFIDLFAGIGGIRLAFENAGAGSVKCVFSSEWDEKAQDTYEAKKIMKTLPKKPFMSLTPV